MALRIVVMTSDRAEKWANALRSALPDAEVINHTAVDDYDKDGIEYAVTWHPPKGALAALPDLKAVCNLGAGVDAIMTDPAFPAHIPVVRLIDPAMTRDMSQWVAYWVLHHYRGFERFRRAQAENTWAPKGYGDPTKTTVGFLGFGEMGGRCAQDLTTFGFNIAAWTRSPRTLEGVTTFAGNKALGAFLNTTNILVGLLPLTPETTGLLNAKTLAMLPAGASVINAGRGKQMALPDLITAMESGHIAGATLDVTDPEPLPNDHPAWAVPNLHITPHISALTYPRTAAGVVADSIRTLMAGGTPNGLVDRSRAY